MILNNLSNLIQTTSYVAMKLGRRYIQYSTRY